MSDRINIKDLRKNAARLMDEGDFKAALTNWNYIKKSIDHVDPLVQFNIGKCNENIDSCLPDAAKAYNIAIRYMAENKDKLEDKLFLELLFSYGQVEYKRHNYTSAIESFKSFLDFVERNSIDLAPDFIDQVKKYIAACENEIQNIFKPGGAVKIAPYPTRETNSKTKTVKSKPYQRLKTISKEHQKEDVEKLWSEMEANKMDIAEGSKWYIISMEWFDQWKKWTGFNPSSTNTTEDNKTHQANSDDVTKDGEIEEPNRIDNYDILDTGDVMLFGEY